MTRMTEMSGITQMNRTARTTRITGMIRHNWDDLGE